MNWELFSILTLIGYATLHIRSVAVLTALLWAMITVCYFAFYYVFPLAPFKVSGVTFLIACIATGAATLVQKVYYQRGYDTVGYVETRTVFYYGLVIAVLTLSAPLLMR